MRRVLFRCAGIRVYSYPFMLYMGIVSGVLIGTYASESRGLGASRTCAAMLLLVIPALVGSRLLYVVSHRDQYRSRPILVSGYSEGGASLYGGLLLALAVSPPLLAGLRVPLGAFWDGAAVTLAVGMAFTKVGCMLNGCCAGRATTSAIGMRLPNVRGLWLRRMPTQLLEAGLALLVLVAAAITWKRLPFDGAFFLSAMLVYAVGRWALEGTRETIDSARGFSLHRALSVAVGALSVTGLLLLGWHFL